MTGYRLESGTVARWLAERGFLDPDEAGAASVEVLAGGVSNDVLGVHSERGDVVVKQALARLRVAEEWLATPVRIGREARALELAGSICPGAVPQVLLLDDVDFVLVMSHAARQARTWKADLLAGSVDSAAAASVGALAGRWHAATLDDGGVAEEFGDLEPFVQLRVDPYHYTIAARHPALAERIDQLAASLLRRGPGRCLVHGDLSPKNVLLGATPSVIPPPTRVVASEAGCQPAGDAPDGIWVIDWEVAHFGDPVFDLAFVLCHLRCKAAHRAADAARLAAAAKAFLGAYAAEAPAVWSTIDPAVLAAQTACLLLARVDGKSPVEYLDESGRDAVRRLAIAVLSSSRPSLEEIFDA